MFVTFICIVIFWEIYCLIRYAQHISKPRAAKPRPMLTKK